MTPRNCHLIEVTAMPDVAYSLILASLEATAITDPVVADAYRFQKHVVYQDPGLLHRVDTIVDGLDAPDTVALSAYFWNRSVAFAIADRVKQRWPESRVVLGGNDVSYQTEFVFRSCPSVDVLVHGEGELTFRALLRQWASRAGSLDDVAGISYQADGTVHTTAPAERILDLSVLPSPLLSGVFPDKAVENSRIVIFETNRGCPYSCAFCYWGGAVGTRVRQFPLERLKDEISYLVEHLADGATLFLADANFGILERDIEIAEWLVQELQRHNKRLFLFTNWAKNPNKRAVTVARILYSNHLIAAVTLSAQSFTPDVLAIAKRSNIKPEYYRTLQREYQELGIPTYTELLWGMPGESLATFREGIETVLETGGTAVIYPLLLLNNTEYSRDSFRAEHAVETEEIPYQVANPEMTAEVVVAHTQMTRADWLRGLELRLGLALFNNCLLKSTLALVKRESGLRIVDLCEQLSEYLLEDCSDAVVRELARNYSTTWTDPAAFDHAFVMRYVDVTAIPEHLHYQAIVREMLATGTYGSVIAEAHDYICQRNGVPLSDRPRSGRAIQLDEAAADVLAAAVAQREIERTVVLDADVGAALQNAGVIHGSSGGHEQPVRVKIGSASFMGHPVDTLLLAIYHGSVRVPRSFESVPADRLTLAALA